MHKKTRWDNLGEITVKTWDFQVKTYPSLEEAVRSLYFNKYWAYDNDTLKYGYLRYCSKNADYRHLGIISSGDTKIFLTCEGVIIPPWKVMEVYNNLPYVEPYRASWARRPMFKFRDGPVHGIRCWRGGGSYHRRPGTHSERRDTAFHEAYDEDCLEYEVKIRGRRRHKSLPTSWDDLSKSDWKAKSWKNYRSHQWKTHI